MTIQQMLRACALLDQALCRWWGSNYPSLPPPPPPEESKGAFGEIVYNYERIAHVRWMLLQIMTFMRDGETEKAMRWLGFAQGYAWAIGASSIDELKDANRSQLTGEEQ